MSIYSPQKHTNDIATSPIRFHNNEDSYISHGRNLSVTTNTVRSARQRKDGDCVSVKSVRSESRERRMTAKNAQVQRDIKQLAEIKKSLDARKI